MSNKKTKIIFISYSDENLNLVKLLENLIIERADLSALIIANNREALKPLAEKVSQGIKESDILIPIFTKESLTAQWINQEIGFATALNKSILPLINKELLPELKGFIHKEIDLPYLFKTKNEEDFIVAAKNLLHDIPFNKSASVDEGGLKKNLSIARSVKTKQIFENKRKDFLESPKSIQLVENEMYNVMFTYLETQLDLIRNETSLFFPNETVKGNHIGYLVKEGPFCFTIVWTKKFNNTVHESKLYMKFWKGNISFDNSVYFPSEKPTLISSREFDIDLDKESNLIWYDENQNIYLTSKDIVDLSFGRLLDAIAT